MIHSMTGFGRAALTVAGRRLTVEIRSVNHRGLDVKLRGRELDPACELEVGQAVRAAVARGALTVAVAEEAAGSAGVDAERVRTVHAALEALRGELGLPGPVDLRTVAAFIFPGGALVPGGALGRGAALDGAGTPPPDWETLRGALEEALRGLRDARAREGAALAVDLQRRMTKLRELVARIEAAAPALPARAARRLEERLAALGAHGPVDPIRLAQEVALLADRLDVSEELVRLEAHLSLMTSLLSAPEPVGRKMDFVVQEIARELNTVGSKVQDAEIAALVIDAKAELEKVREQAQNVE